MQKKLIKKIQPHYPELARRNGIAGLVVISLTIDVQGRVQTLNVVQGPALLTPAAVMAVSQWQYLPTLLNGEAVPVSTAVTVNFTLRNPDQTE